MGNELTGRILFRHLLLFVLTFISTSFTGAFFVGHTAGIPEGVILFSSEGLPYLMDMIFWEGVLFAVLLLGFLGVHEFGHYFAALRHRIHVTLPYFIPLPISPIGTIGAVIRIKSRIQHTRHMFDVGASGPIAGFIVALVILLYGFATLPDPDYLQNFGGHEAINEYIAEHGTFPDDPLAGENRSDIEVMTLGNTLLFSFIASFFDNVPPMWELYHYPFLFAGWLGLFFTALNLLPVGQLDGGHILYTLIGYRRHRLAARGFFVLVLTLAGLGAIPLINTLISGYDIPQTAVAWILWILIALLLLDRAFRHDIRWILGGLGVVLAGNLLLLRLFEPSVFSGFTIWIFWSLFIVFLVKIEHPPVVYEEPLTPGRKILGWLCMIIFFLCISPNPIYFL
ncbi:site-2 protease family protein [Balneolales bacterium ANBcel1]|nr:site-2 protease family protein [Balneolales bacterium ANBcel1]